MLNTINVNRIIHLKKRDIKKLLVIFVFLLLNNITLFFIEGIKINLLDVKYQNLVKFNEFSFSNFFKNINAKHKLIFNLTSISFSFDSNNNIIKTDFTIDFYDENKNIIIPSDLTLYYDFHIYCIMKDLSHITRIISLPNIIQNKHFICQELFHINEKIHFGIGIYQKNKLSQNKEFHLFTYNKSLYGIDNIINNQQDYLDCFNTNKEYALLYEKMYKSNIIYDNLKLKASYILKPKCSSKYDSILLDNKWHFINLYNYYYCLCKGLFCKYQEISQKCKYFLYLNIIDNNKDLFTVFDREFQRNKI